jgi:hypothetical protein
VEDTILVLHLSPPSKTICSFLITENEEENEEEEEISFFSPFLIDCHKEGEIE